MDMYSDSRQSSVVKREEKEERITEFVSYYFDQLLTIPSDDRVERHVTLIARAPDSPVVRGLSNMMSDLIGQGVMFSVVFAKLQPSDLLSEWLQPEIIHSDAFAEHGIRGKVISEVRCARHPSLIEGHEQLVLGRTMSWAGDSMRREASKIDAFECYEIDCPEAAVLASRSFENMWRICEPISGGVSGLLPKGEKPTGGVDSEVYGERAVRSGRSPSIPSRH